MALGDLMGPQQGAPVGPPSPAQPQGTPGDPGLMQRWGAYLAHPAISAALLQFAASVMQPIGRGSVMGQIGNALADAGGAAGRVEATDTALQQQDIENQQRERQLSTQERAAEASTASSELDRGRLDIMRQQEARIAGGTTPLTAKEKADLEIERQRNQILAASGRENTALSPQQQIAMKGFDAEKDLIIATEADPTKAQQAIEAAHKKWFPGGGPVGPIAPPPFTELQKNPQEVIAAAKDPQKLEKLYATYGKASIDSIIGTTAPGSAATAKEGAKAAPSVIEPAPSTSGGAALDPATGLLDPNMMPPEQIVKIAEEPSTDAAYRKAYPAWDAILTAAKAKIPVKVRIPESPAVTKEKIKRAGALE